MPGPIAFSNLERVTAYDQQAVRAFETETSDYLLKPVQPAHLQKTVNKLQATLARDVPAEPHSCLEQLRRVLAAASRTEKAPGPITPLSRIQVSRGHSIRLVALHEVIYFEAANKYVRVLTAMQEYLIRTPLKDLLPQLDASNFWQIHRGTVVNASAIEAVHRDASGKLLLQLRLRPEKLTVSRLYSAQFRAM
jgi:DNA-binding LytR/AlgR family response regulator